MCWAMLGYTAAQVAAASAAAATIGAAGISAYSSYQTAKSNQSAAQAEQQSLEQQATTTRQSAAYEAEQKIEQGKQARAKAAVQYASSGINPNTGTASDIQQDIVGNTTADTLNITNNAERKAWGLEEEGQLKVNQANKAVKNSLWSGGATLLGSAGTAAAFFA